MRHILAGNSATVRGFDFPSSHYDDLYKYALEKCLDNCAWVAVLVPESFICSGIYRERLTDFVSLKPDLFTDAAHPVGLALFIPDSTEQTDVGSGDSHIGTLANLKARKPESIPDGPVVRFNDPLGNVGLIALDNTRTASIRFCPVEELADYEVKKTARHITKIHVEGRTDIARWNEYLGESRKWCNDVLLTCYKGIRKDGMRRNNAEHVLDDLAEEKDGIIKKIASYVWRFGYTAGEVRAKIVSDEMFAK